MVDPVILDACCALNLSATGRIDGILRQLPYRFSIGCRARSEALWLAIPASEEREPVDLQPLNERGLLTDETLRGPVEETLFVQLSARLQDGEAEAAALAINRGYILATDDRKARRVVSEIHPRLRLSNTLQLVWEWQQAAGPSDAHVADALRRIAARATYRPRRSDPLFDWWMALAGE
jgi:hypothetical protein